MPEADKEFVKLVGDLLVNAKGFCDFGINRGLMTEEDVRLTIAKRQEKARELVAAGMSQREAAKALGVSKTTIQADVKPVVGNRPQGGRKPTAEPPRPSPRTHTLSDPIEPPCIGCEAEEQWQRSVQNNAGDAASLEAFWTRQFGQDWHQYTVTPEMVSLAQDAAKSWAAISKQLASRLKGKRK